MNRFAWIALLLVFGVSFFLGFGSRKAGPLSAPISGTSSARGPESVGDAWDSEGLEDSSGSGRSRIRQFALRAPEPEDAGESEAPLKPSGRSSAKTEISLKSDEDILDDEYDFTKSELNPADVAGYYSFAHPPARIAYYGALGEPEMVPRKSGARSEKGMQWGLGGGMGTLSFSSEALAARIAQERSQAAAVPAPQFPATDPGLPAGAPEGAGTSSPSTPVVLPEFGWKIVRFTPGKTNSGGQIRPKAALSFSLQGPDYSLEDVDESDSASLDRIRSRVLSFGHGGALLLEVARGGELRDEPGADFVIFENVFSMGGGKLYMEFAKVGVSMSPDPATFVWFSCDPDKGKLAGCAGVVPTSKGGDAFDLGAVGLAKARYLKIVDWGRNAGPDSGAAGGGTEGFDLDAVRWLHAYSIHP